MFFYHQPSSPLESQVSFNEILGLLTFLLGGEFRVEYVPPIGTKR
jgi:hypothetical protein